MIPLGGKSAGKVTKGLFLWVVISTNPMEEFQSSSMFGFIHTSITQSTLHGTISLLLSLTFTSQNYIMWDSYPYIFPKLMNILWRLVWTCISWKLTYGFKEAPVDLLPFSLLEFWGVYLAKIGNISSSNTLKNQNSSPLKSNGWLTTILMSSEPSRGCYKCLWSQVLIASWPNCKICEKYC